MTLLSYGSAGDMVLWMQELLASAIPAQRTTGTFGSQTLADLRNFQARHHIPATGQTGPLTWRALLRLSAVRVRWAAGDVRSARDAHANRGVGPPSRVAPAPESAALSALGHEIHKPTGTDGAR